MCIRYKKKKSVIGLSLFSKKFMFFLVWFWWKEFELIRTVRSGWCFFKVKTQFVSAVYNVKYLKMDCLVYG